MGVFTSNHYFISSVSAEFIGNTFLQKNRYCTFYLCKIHINNQVKKTSFLDDFMFNSSKSRCYWSAEGRVLNLDAFHLGRLFF
jgi:hypothetical protein